MKIPSLLLSATLSAGAAAPAAALPVCPAGRVDSLDQSRHIERRVRVNDVCVSVLDWGGRGQLMIFMPGYGNTAHVFDDLAPAFTDHAHVVGLTPRGFPPSDAPESAYTIAQLAEDVRVLMDSLGTQNAILVGHSISGAVITEFGQRYPKRLSAAVYLDAAFDFGAAYRRAHLPERPLPDDTTSATYRAWRGRYDEASWSRSIMNASDADDRSWQIDAAEIVRRNQLVSALAREARARPHEPWHVTAPILAIYAHGTMDRVFGWLTPDSARWLAATAYYEKTAKESRDEQVRLATLARSARVVELESSHFVFFDQRQAVIEAMRSFLRI
jgi:pimeloyl-ACP methyl ester carboxylesterase